MTAEEYEKRPYHLGGFLLTTRVLASMVVALMLLGVILVFYDVIRHHGLSALITALNEQLFLTITLTFILTGLILAYWKEGLGGAVSLVSLVVLFIVARDFHVSFIVVMSVMAVPSMLYVIYWWMVFRFHREQRAGD